MSYEQIIERAFELARSGDYPTVDRLARQLSREGFSSVHDHLQGSQIRKQLNAIFADHRRKVAETTIIAGE